MINHRHSLLLALLSLSLSHAEELAIESKPFEIVHQLDAQVMPVDEVPLVQIAARSWQSFTITRLAAHGSAVKKGDVLVSFDSRDIDKRLEGLKRQIAAGELSIADTRDKLSRLEETAAQRLQDAKREAAESKERLDYFTKTGRKAEEDEALHAIKRNQQWLDNEKEELRQLKQMYEADDLTEDTEEIILTRQKDAVESAELMLRLAKLSQSREIEVLLPRKAESLALAANNAAIALKYAERQIPREIEQTKAQLEALTDALAKDRIQLADLEVDRKFFEITASTSGTFYHGCIADGRWVTGELLRGLRVGGSAPLQTAFASLVPSDAKLQLVAITDAAKARQLTEKTSAIAMLSGAETLAAKSASIPAVVTERSLVPDTQGNYQVSFKPTWPEGVPTAVGNPAKLHVLVHDNPKAIVVPAKALKYGAKGWSVELKLADGKSERRTVTRGAQSGENVEILSGLEVGQVIIVP